MDAIQSDTSGLNRRLDSDVIREITEQVLAFWATEAVEQVLAFWAASYTDELYPGEGRVRLFAACPALGALAHEVGANV